MARRASERAQWARAPGGGGTQPRRWLRPMLANAACACLGSQAAAAPEWPPVVAGTIVETCAVRGLALRSPLEVRPMAAFDGGYTPGIGSVVWAPDHAAIWRRGWCALGVYCRPPHPDGQGEASASPLQRPRGLYDPESAALYLAADGDRVPAATIAHETTHALQLQNYPHLAAIHLWHNRDLAAAANAAIEGDAHVVGWAFDAERRLSVCSMDPVHAEANLARRWGWRPDGFWAHEGFPHVFGPRLALERQLAAGNAGANELLRRPPLSTRQVLAPAATPAAATPAAATFIDLAVDLEAQTLAKRGCERGLANTAGAVGIWGLLLAHGSDGVDATALPGFLEGWRGDRFLHVSCDGERNDDLAWLTLWRSAEEAQEFARRYRSVAAAATALGGVLGDVPRATRQGEQVLVATPGLAAQQAALFAAPRRTFSSYEEWTASNCFPQARCDPAPQTTPAAASSALRCAGATPSSRLADWLERTRLARQRHRQAAASQPDREPTERLEAVGASAGKLAAFCVRNSIGNADLALACRALVDGVRHWRAWQADGNWRLLPHCASGAELKNWLRDGYHPDAQRPFAAAETFPGIYGPAFVAAAVAGSGNAGVERLLANPPLSTGALLGLPSAPVDFARVPEAALASVGCAVAATEVRGPLGIWTLLLDHGAGQSAGAPPRLLADWRGDRQFYLRCGQRSGWIWASRWRHRQAAHRFANAYAALSASVAETGLAPGRPRRKGRTVWVGPEAFRQQLEALARGATWHRFASWQEWQAAGCFPRDACRGRWPEG